MKRILVVVTRQIGDVLLTTPLIDAAHSLWPGAQVDVLGFAGTLGMLRGNAQVHERIETPARLGVGGALSLVRRLWRRYDLALVAETSDRAHLLGWVAARERAGIVPPAGGSNWIKRRLLDHEVVSAGDAGEVHVVEEKLRLLDRWRGNALAPARVQPPPAMPLPPEVEAALQPGAVVIHAPSMWPYKQWPPARFHELAREIIARGRQVVLTGGPGAADRACVDAVKQGLPQSQLLDACGRLDFNQLAGLLTRAAVYVGPDTSVSHLAAAAGVPVVAVFGPTNPLRWAPWPVQNKYERPQFQRRSLAQSASNVTVVQSSLPCVPCTRAGCDNHRASRADCLPDIAAQRVLAEVLRHLAD